MPINIGRKPQANVPSRLRHRQRLRLVLAARLKDLPAKIPKMSFFQYLTSPGRLGCRHQGKVPSGGPLSARHFGSCFWQRCHANLLVENNKSEGAMRKATQKAGAIVTVIAFAFSASALADPLAPGKPAGVRAAQDVGNKEWLVFGGIGVVLAGVLIANAGAGEHAASQPSPIPVITTTT